MPELLLECLSEEIPARFQAKAAADLARLVGEALAPIGPRAIRTFSGPRRLAVTAEVEPGLAARVTRERGPRVTAPAQALDGFLRKHAASRDALRQDGEFWVIEKASAAQGAAELIAAALPPLLWRFPWAKSMRWGGTSAFAWVRPLRRILCLLDGEAIAFSLAQGGDERGTTDCDDGHGLVAGNTTEGHRFHAPGAAPVHSAADWQAVLRARYVIPEAAERARIIAAGLAALAAEKGLSVVGDQGLLDEVAGLVEWPVPLLGRIDDGFMDLPPEVMQVSMRINQRYFALRMADGTAAPYFAFAANIAAADGGAAIIEGNERVLRARFADARHFWDLDRRTALAERLAALDRVTFQAELGTQGERARRLATLSRVLAVPLGADPALAARAALLSKADLVSGMVGEFPELQGVMGGYYAAHDGEAPEIAQAIAQHYAPRGPADAVPAAPVAMAVALADKLDQLAGFFSIGEKPSGAGDPFALRRAALGVIRIVRENRLRLALRDALRDAAAPFAADPAALAHEVLGFIVERLRVQLRGEGARHDVLAAVFAAGADDDLNRALARTAAIGALLRTADGANLLAAYRRAANILRIEDRKDGPHDGAVADDLLQLDAERDLVAALDQASASDVHLAREDFAGAMGLLASLRQPLDAFFATVTVNADEVALRRNRLRLLHRVRRSIDRVADFGKIEA